MLEQIDHVNLVVRDLKAMLAFYRDVLGLQVVKDVAISGAWIDAVVGLQGVEARVIYLALPAGPRIELIDYRAPRGAAVAGQDLPHTPGLRHLAFKVPDLDRAFARLAQAGVRFLAPPQQVPDAQVQFAGGARKRLAYFHDPEGNLLELCEYR